MNHRQTPASCSKFDRENQSVQPGTPSRLRQPSPLKELWARSQAAAAGQSSPSKPVLPSPSPLKLHLFGRSHRPFPTLSFVRRVFTLNPQPLLRRPKRSRLFKPLFRVAASPKPPANAQVLGSTSIRPRVSVLTVHLCIQFFSALRFSNCRSARHVTHVCAALTAPSCLLSASTLALPVVMND